MGSRGKHRRRLAGGRRLPAVMAVAAATFAIGATGVVGWNESRPPAPISGTLTGSPAPVSIAVPTAESTQSSQDGTTSASVRTPPATSASAWTSPMEQPSGSAAESTGAVQAPGAEPLSTTATEPQAAAAASVAPDPTTGAAPASLQAAAATVSDTPQPGASTAITTAWLAAGGAAGWLGDPQSADLPGPAANSVLRQYTGGTLFWSAATGVQALRGAIRLHWLGLSAAVKQELGVPVAAESSHLTTSRISRFSGGAVMWHPVLGGHEIYGAIASRYLSDPLLQARLGAAISGEGATDFTGGRVNRFFFGAVMWTPTVGVTATSGAVGARYNALPAATRTTLGALLHDEADGPVAGSRTSPFQAGGIWWQPGQPAVALWGPIWQHYVMTPGLGAKLGIPTSEPTPAQVGDPSTRARWATFSRAGHILWSPETGAHVLAGAIGVRYSAMTAVDRASLGMLTTDETDFAGGRANRFASGVLYWHARTGTHEIIKPAVASPEDGWSQAYFGAAEVLVERSAGWLPQFLRPINFAGDGGPASAARIAQATTIAADGKGGYYFADSANQRVRHVDAAGIIRTVVGTGQATGSAGPACAWGRPALQTCLNWVHGVSVDSDGGLIITDSFNHVVTKLGHDGIVRRLAGNGERCIRASSTCGEGGSALNASLDRPTTSRRIGAILYISDSSDRIVAVGADGIMRRVAGTGAPGFSGDEGPATSAKLWGPADMLGYRGGLLISDGNNCRLRWVDPQGTIHAFAGYGTDLNWCWRNYGEPKNGPAETRSQWGLEGPMTGDVGDGGPAVWSRLSVTGFLADLGNGEVCVTDFLNYRVRCIDDSGAIRTVVGGVYLSPSNVPLRSAGVNGPLPAERFGMGWAGGIAYDQTRNRLLVSDGRIIGVDIPMRMVSIA